MLLSLVLLFLVLLLLLLRRRGRLGMPILLSDLLCFVLLLLHGLRKEVATKAIQEPNEALACRGQAPWWGAAASLHSWSWRCSVTTGTSVCCFLLALAPSRPCLFVRLLTKLLLIGSRPFRRARDRILGPADDLGILRCVFL